MPTLVSAGRWWERAAGYEIYVPSFADGNGDGLGDLPGIRERLEYLAWLGIDLIWLIPFYRSPLADHGYDVADLAYFYCHMPPGRACSSITLVRVAGRRWPVEEDFRRGKSDFGLADSRVRRYTALTRHLALAMAALAVCAVTAALASPRTRMLARPPASPDDLPPADPGLIPLTVSEIKRIFNLVTRTWHTIRHYLHWSWWRRRHQARARWFHQRARLRRHAPHP